MNAAATSATTLTALPLLSPVVTTTTNPRITVSTLARAMGPITLSSLATLLRGHKYNSAGPRRSYQAARRQAKAAKKG